MKKDYTQQELEELILLEKRAVTRELINQAWDEAALEEIETSIIAETCINLALEKLASTGNSADISRLIKHFKNLDELGVMPVSTTLQ